MFGKIENGILVLAGEKIQIENGWITNPTEEQLKKLGYKTVKYTERPIYDKEEEKLVETYTETDVITVNYEKVALTDEEKRQNLENKVSQLEQQYNMYRWQRELILSNNSGASSYTKDKAQQIETLAEGLR